MNYALYTVSDDHMVDHTPTREGKLLSDIILVVNDVIVFGEVTNATVTTTSKKGS